MKLIVLFTIVSSMSVLPILGKYYKITEEDKAFEEAKEKGKAVAYVFG